jgi:2-polyprenyl-3-methyl-5-hydroxy-6-metoxy-1,4-benzoquinol methylase
MVDMSETTNSFRRRRMAWFLKLVDPILARKGEATILDIGGTVGYWRTLQSEVGDRNIRITLVNLGVEPRDEGMFSIRPGNACAMPEFADNSFDVVHSNSVIEHVGHWQEMRAMANEVRRLAPAYFLQTPNVGFPIEAHFSLPFIHWLPEQMRAAILRAPKGKYLPRDAPYDAAIEMVQRVVLLSQGQLRELFPDAEVRAERVLGLAKSWIAVRGDVRG